MSTAPKINFSTKPGPTTFIPTSQLQPQGQPLIASYMDPNPNPAYVYNPSQVITGQPTNVVAPNPTYNYSINQDGSNNWRNTGAGATTGQIGSTVVQPPVKDEIEKAQFSRGSQGGQLTKKLGPDADPHQETRTCHPAWWILGGLIALALLTLALLWGLGVIGGKGSSNSSTVSTSQPVSPVAAGTNTNTNHPSGSTSTSVSGSSASGAKSGGSSASGSGSGSTTSSSGSGSTNTGGSSGVSGSTSVSPVPFTGPSGGQASPTQPTKPATVQPATVQPGSVKPIVVPPSFVEPAPVEIDPRSLSDPDYASRNSKKA